MTISTLRRHTAAFLTTACLLWQPLAHALDIPVASDVQVWQGNGTYNFGANDNLRVDSTASNNRWFYLKFDTTVGSYLPSGTTANDISRALLTFYVNTVTTGGNIDVYDVSASWTEGTADGAASGSDISWNNKPASTGSVLGTINVATGQKYKFVTFDVTDIVQDWVSGTTTNNGLVFKPNGSVNVYFDSKESGAPGNQPTLNIVLSNGGSSTLSAINAGTWTGANSITTLGTIGTGTWAGTSIALANGGTGASTASGARTNLGLAIGSNVQAWDADLDDLADGSLSGSKVGSGISAANVNTGTLALGHGGTGSANGSITGTGALTFTSGSSNTNITITPNGTGRLIVTSDALVGSSVVGMTVGLGNGGYASNTVVGIQALYSNTLGDQNTALGHQALYSNTQGGLNTALGLQALYSNTVGNNNTAVGNEVLYTNTSGSYNIACGYRALAVNTTGANNLAAGGQALTANTIGNSNTGIGRWALSGNTTGTGNIGIGYSGGGSLTTGNYNICIGNVGIAGESGKIRIGDSNQTAAYVAGIYGATASSGVAVYIDSNGHLGTLTSSRRFKQDISNMNASSEAILSLRPVNFRYKPELDSQGIPQYGLIAEEVAEIAPDLVARDAKGEIYTVRYEAVNAMLLNEFQKEHKRVQEQEQAIAKQQKQIEELTSMVAEMNRRIQKKGGR